MVLLESLACSLSCDQMTWNRYNRMMIGIGIPISQRSAPRIVASERQVELGNVTLPKVGGFRCGGCGEDRSSAVHLPAAARLQIQPIFAAIAAIDPADKQEENAHVGARCDCRFDGRSLVCERLSGTASQSGNTAPGANRRRGPGPE